MSFGVSPISTRGFGWFRALGLKGFGSPSVECLVCGFCFEGDWTFQCCPRQLLGYLKNRLLMGCRSSLEGGN